MARIFSNSSPKIPKSDTFSPKFKDCNFCTKLCNKTKDADSKYDNSIIKFQPKNRVRKAEMVKIQTEVDDYREGIHRNWMSRAIISISVIRVRTVFQTGVCYKCYRLVSISVPDRQVVA